MAFPRNFLTDIAREKELSPREKEVFLALLGDDKSRVQIAEKLHVEKSAISTCLTGIYRKFQIADNGPVKEKSLRTYLTNRYLRWKPENSEDSSIIDSAELSIDVLVREVRQQIQHYIQEKCGTIRVLDMNQPISLGEIYTNINILEKRTRTSQRETPIPGLEAVENFSKLMILGKPGAGKTTFLKHLAIQCISGEFQAERVPVFVTLKDFVKTDENSDLLEHLARSILINPLKTPNFESLQNVVRAGRALILLDGLDEVRDADSDWVLRQIQDLLKFSQNQFVITCRITSREDTFEQFTKVEIADFDDEQIAYFFGKWFDPIKAGRFQQKLKENERIRGLAKNPLLLTLLCLVFEDSGNFPTNRASLYQQCVEQLLRKWNPLERECDPIYRNLSPDYREELISEIAWKTFECGNFNQREVKEQIREYIRNLGISPEDLLKLDSQAVVESIETQHGLLEKQTRGSYSFSHLTFHEYFTANKIVTSVEANGCLPLEALVTHITEPRWREVFLLAVEMLPRADELLQLMKHHIDKLLTNDEKVQQLLGRIYKIYSSQEFPFHFPVPLSSFKSISLSKLVVHSLYFECELRYIHDIALGLEIEQYQNQYENIDCYFCYSVLFSKTYDLKSNRDIALRLEPKLRRALTKHMDSTFSNPIALKLFKLLDPVKRPTIYKIYEDENNQKNASIFGAERAWWKNHGSSWNREFKSFIAKYRSQLNAKQLSKEQREKLRNYYDANVLLVDCLKSDCKVSPEVKKEIEQMLLLPISEIGKRQQSKLS